MILLTSKVASWNAIQNNCNENNSEQSTNDKENYYNLMKCKKYYYIAVTKPDVSVTKRL